METLTERQHIILKRLVDAHILSAQPVGSRHLSERYEMHFSPATIRHEMGCLEEMGYLTHPHTSSGRVPTDSGYRHYVNHCEDERLSLDQRIEEWEQGLSEESLRGDRETLAEYTSRMLSAISEEVGLNVLCDTDAEATQRGRPERLFVQGASNLLQKPEFRDREKICALFNAFEEKQELIQWISNRVFGGGVAVVIGRENEPETFWDCSIISACYFLDGHKIGTLALIGPRRMHYARSRPLVQGLARMMERLLEHGDAG